MNKVIHINIYRLASVSELIKKKRIELGLTKARMARRLGVSNQLLSNYEEGKHKPKTDFFQKWKSIFNEDLLSINIEKDSYSSEPAQENNLFKEEEKPISGTIATLARIIEKQQETIHFLTTGRSQGGGDPLSKKVSG